MIRPTAREDVPRLLELAAATGVFMRYDLETLDGVLADYFAPSDPDANGAEQHVCVTCEDAGRIVGFVYFAETEFADRTWFVWWIAVEKGTQGRGVGRRLLAHAEDDARGRGGRVMFIETSGTAAYEPTRRFYVRNDYDREAVLRDYYRDGDDKVVFRKRLTGTVS
jgi:ribosomal protein S18 acetylase RimI-like enzyme